MRSFLGLNCLLLLFVSAFITGFAFCQDNSFNTLVEGSFWNYVSTVTLNMEAFEDEFEASLRDVMTTRGNVTVLKSHHLQLRLKIGLLFNVNIIIQLREQRRLTQFIKLRYIR